MTIDDSKTVPKVLLILGMDGSGKNYAANLASEYISNAGFAVEKRERKLSGKPTDVTTSEDKNWFDLASEKLFLYLFPYFKTAVPFVVYLLLKKDLNAFRKNKSSKIAIVIGHTALRLLAFYLGHVYQNSSDIKIPQYLERTLNSMVTKTGVKTIVLDIENQIRRKRIAIRAAKGKMDNMDRYMADPRNIELSERIEAFLVWIATKYLQAIKIDNNDLGDRALLAQMQLTF
jgi:thymidylate kinase